MGRIGSVVVSKAEEGEISDSESVEEITKQDFVKDSGYSRARADGGGCWIKYNPAGYASTLANYAWLQAVKNKPLTDPCLGVGRMAPAPAAAAVTETVILDSGDEDEKEEGELEEGEIDGDVSGGENPLEMVASESSEEEDVVAAQVSLVESESDKMAEDFELLKKTKSVEEVFVTLIETERVDKYV